ncbi:hypothetical protein SALCHL_006140 [Streptomyces albus subsp. chlorinus]|uniref:hypothetical protein n=1 Tax=Streptomyces albus TaxID=1888 RepID=UPI001FABE80F|nr:hypothetical protein [Streptomyces albus]
MGALVPFLLTAVVLAAVLGFFAWLASHVRRRGLAGGAMSAALASYEEAFRITAHESRVEIRAQSDRKAPTLSPDGHGGRGSGLAGGTGEGDAAGRRSARRNPRRPRRPRRGPARWFARVKRDR